MDAPRTPYGYKREVTFSDGSTKVFARSARAPQSVSAWRFVAGDPAEVEIVREIFARLASGGLGYSTLAHDLNRRGVPSPSNKRWHPRALRDLITNPVYTGDLVWNKVAQGKFKRRVGGKIETAEQRPTRNDPRDWVVIPDHHEALISRETWAQAQQALAARKPGKVALSRSYALTGLAVCSVCGASLVGSTIGGVRRYRCTASSNWRTCEAWTVNAATLERAVLAVLQRTVAGLDRAAIRERILNRLATRIGNRAQAIDIAKLQREHGELERRIDQATENMGAVGPVAAKRLAAKIEQWAARQQEIAAELAKAEERSDRLEDLEAMADEAVAIVDDLLGARPDAGPERLRALFGSVAGTITVEVETDVPAGRKQKRHRFQGADVGVQPPLAMALLAGSELRSGGVGEAPLTQRAG